LPRHGEIARSAEFLVEQELKRLVEATPDITLAEL
jgi:hypothetical protein